MRRSATKVFVGGLVLVAAGCQTASHAERGALFGGLTGAGLGAAIGDATGHAGPGAAIGAGIGTLAGATIGGDVDQAEAQMHAAQGAVAAQGINVTDVMRMTQAGVGDSVIINQIHAQGSLAPPTTDEVIYLQQHGVSPDVIRAYQEAPQIVMAQPAPATTVVVGPRPVVRGVVVAPPMRVRPVMPMRPYRHRFHW